MTNDEAANVLRIMASGIKLKGYTEHWISGFKEAYEMAIKILEERSQGEWAGINDYLKHLEEETGERYKVSSIYDGSIFCNQCWEMTDKKSHFCPNCGAEMMKGDTDESES